MSDAIKEIELISSKECPFVMRSVVMLFEKDIKFKMTYIDLDNKPDWFLKLSPLGKVPVLKVGDKVLFESVVINEYLDEITPPTIRPNDPFARALNKSWKEFGTDLLFTLYYYFCSPNRNQASAIKDEFLRKLSFLEKQMNSGPFFNGSNFSLIDASYAPFFYHMDILGKKFDVSFLDHCPKIKTWSEAMLKRESIKNSAPPELEDLLMKYLKKHNSCFV